jgi:hypothetical protein
MDVLTIVLVALGALLALYVLYRLSKVRSLCERRIGMQSTRCGYSSYSSFDSVNVHEMFC